MTMWKVPFLDMTHKISSERSALHTALDRVLDSKVFILGKEVELFEAEFERDLGVSAGHGISCNSGTDALVLSLKVMGVEPGSEVIVPSHTAVPTVTAIRSLGAIPRFADVNKDTWVLDCRHALALKNSRTRAIIAVHLYGNSVNLGELADVKELVLEDVAQAHGGEYQGKALGSWARCGAYSFYPTKNLGAFGDGGALLCSSQAEATRARALRFYGQSSRYCAEIDLGVNSRLDELQAAFLRIRMATFRKELARKTKIRETYEAELKGLPLEIQRVTPGSIPAWHLFVVAFDSLERREKVKANLEKAGIGSLIHYPVPNHLQPAFTEFRRESLPVTEALCPRILSLPFHADLGDAELEQVVKALRAAL